MAKGRDYFTRDGLSAAGFTGWRSFEDVRTAPKEIPTYGGVYVVLRDPAEPTFLAINPGGRFKHRDPTVPDSALRASWVDGASVIYIGKADQLRRRLRQFADFGAGKPIGHWGGRLIWQLANSTELLVAWKVTPGLVPKTVEDELIADFRGAFGKPPFANDPHRLGS